MTSVRFRSGAVYPSLPIMEEPGIAQAAFDLLFLGHIHETPTQAYQAADDANSTSIRTARGTAEETSYSVSSRASVTREKCIGG